MFPFSFARTAFQNGRPRAGDASDTRHSPEVGRLVDVCVPYDPVLEELAQTTLGLYRQPFEPLSTFAARCTATVGLRQAQLALVAEQLRPFATED